MNIIIIIKYFCLLKICNVFDCLIVMVSRKKKVFLILYYFFNGLYWNWLLFKDYDMFFINMIDNILLNKSLKLIVIDKLFMMMDKIV